MSAFCLADVLSPNTSLTSGIFAPQCKLEANIIPVAYMQDKGEKHQNNLSGP